MRSCRLTSSGALLQAVASVPKQALIDDLKQLICDATGEAWDITGLKGRPWSEVPDQEIRETLERMRARIRELSARAPQWVPASQVFSAPPSPMRAMALR